MQNMVEPTLEQLDDMLIVQGHEDVASLLAGADEAFVAQTAQLMRNGGPGQPEALHQFAHTHLAAHERIEDAHAGGVAEGSEEIGKAGGYGRGEGSFLHVHRQFKWLKIVEWLLNYL